MFKKQLIAILAVILLLPSTLVYGQSGIINKENLNKGLIDISYTSNQDKRTKVMVAKGDEKYTYDLNGNGQFPLQLGNGQYTVSVLENVTDNKYKVVTSTKLDLATSNPNLVYLQSTEMIKWSNDMKSVNKAKELTKGLETDKDKATAIYNYIVNNVKYDNNKAVSVNVGYVPQADLVLDSQLGICFDYSVLYAVMLRSVGVPTKMLMGRNKDITDYHAWNEVYLKETNEWVVVDTTYDAGNVQKGIEMPMAKDSSDYTTQKQY